MNLDNSEKVINDAMFHKLVRDYLQNQALRENFTTRERIGLGLMMLACNCIVGLPADAAGFINEFETNEFKKKLVIFTCKNQKDLIGKLIKIMEEENPDPNFIIECWTMLERV